MAFAAWQYQTCGRPLEFTAAAVFTLHPVSGQPLIVSGDYCLYLDWEGAPLLVMTSALPSGGQPRDQVTRYRIPAHDVQIGKEVLHFESDVICTTLQPPMPAGWQRLLVVTTGRGRTEKWIEFGYKDESLEDVGLTWERLDAYFYDYNSTELLAEINLNSMYNTLYANALSEELMEANVRGACLSPSGDLAIIIYFKNGHGSWYETGIWCHDTWIPIPESQPFLQHDCTLYVGPAGWTIFCRRIGDIGFITFYDPSGLSKAEYSWGKPQLRALAASALRLMRNAALVAAAASLLSVLLLAFIWHFLLPAMPRRRLESRRADPQ